MIEKLLIFIYLLSSYSAAIQARSIALLAYGSLVNEPSRGGHSLKLKKGFEDSGLKLPISMRRHSGIGTPNERITAVIDTSQGQAKTVYFASMDFPELKNARENLSFREGSEGKVTFVHYIKKNLPNLATENPIEGAPGWFIRKPEGKGDYLNDVQLSHEEAKKIADWAAAKGFDAVIWASYPPNLAREQEVAEKLVRAGQDSELYKNTVSYINQLPHKAETPFEKAVVSGVDALKELRDSLALGKALAKKGPYVTGFRSCLKIQ